MKKRIYIFAAAVCFALAGVNHVYANLVTNPGFEDPIVSEWTWHLVTNSVPVHGRDSTNYHSGSFSYHIFAGDAAPAIGYIEQTIHGVPGASYTITGWILVPFRPTDKNWGYIEVAGGGATVSAPAKGANQLVWEQMTLFQTADTNGDLYVRLYLNHFGGTTGGKNNSVYFDDIVVDGPGPEPAKLVYTSVPTRGVAGTPFGVTVQAQDTAGHPANVTNTTTVTLSVGSGAGSLSGTISGDIAAGDSSVTISGATYDTAGTMTLTATPTAGMTAIAPVTSGNIIFAATLDWGSADANWTDANVWRNSLTGTPGTYNDASQDRVVFEDTHSGTGDRMITLTNSVSPGNVSMTAAKNFTISGSGSIAGLADLNKDGAGTLTLATSNSFNGTTRIVTGTLAVVDGNALQGSTLDLNSTDTGALVFGSSVTAASLGGLKGDTVALLGRGVALTNGSGGAVSLTVGGNNTSTTFNGSMSGSGSFTKTGTGILSLGIGGVGDAWTNDGDITVDQGTLRLNAPLLPHGAGKGNFIVNGTAFNDGRTITVNGLSGTGTLTSGANFDSIVWRVGDNDASSTFNGVIKRLPAKSSTLYKIGAGTLTLGGNNSIGVSGGAGDPGVHILAGKIVAAHTNAVGDYLCYVGDGAALEVANVVLNDKLALWLTNHATLRASGGANSASGSGPITVEPAAAVTVSTAASADVLSLRGPVDGGDTSSLITVAGPGKVVLTNVSGYAGNWQVEGTMLVNSPGVLAGNGVAVGANGTLGGSGTIFSPVTVNANGTIGGGASAGILTLGIGLSLGAGGTNLWELAANDIFNPGGNSFDQLVVTSGSLAIAPASVLAIRFIGTATAPSLADPFWQYPRQWKIIDVNGGSNPGPSNFAAIDGTNGITAGTFTTTGDATGVTLVYTPSVTPPPPTAASVSLTAGSGSNYTLSYAGGSGRQFVLVTSPDVNLPLSSWTPMATNVAVTGSFTVAIPDGVNASSFYRIRSEP